MNSKLGRDCAIGKRRRGGVRRAAIFPNTAQNHAARRIVKSHRIAAPLVRLLWRQFIRPRHAFARQAMNELTAGDANVLPWRMVPGAIAIEREIEACFSVGPEIAVKDIIENRAQIFFCLRPWIVSQPRLHVGSDRGRVALAQMKHMTGPICDRRHQRVAKWRGGRIASTRHIGSVGGLGVDCGRQGQKGSGQEQPPHAR